MGLFSNKLISTDKVNKSLVKFFNTNYDSLLEGFQEVLKKDINIDKNQYKELMFIPMIAIIKAIPEAFGDSQISKDLLGKFQKKIFNNFKDTEEKNNFSELFYIRIKEYDKIIRLDNTNLDIQFGQIFYQNFYKKEPELNDAEALAIMTFMGLAFLNQYKNIINFLDEIRQNYVFI